MAVTSEVSSVEHPGNGATTAFPVPFKFLESGDLVVTSTVDATGVSTVLTIGSTAAGGHYTVSGAGDDAGGSVTMNTAPATGTTISIVRTVTITQETAFRSAGSFSAKTHEEALDYRTFVDQQLQRNIDDLDTSVAADVAALDARLDAVEELTAGIDAERNSNSIENACESVVAVGSLVYMHAAGASDGRHRVRPVRRRRPVVDRLPAQPEPHLGRNHRMIRTAAAVIITSLLLAGLAIADSVPVYVGSNKYAIRKATPGCTSQQAMRWSETAGTWACVDAHNFRNVVRCSAHNGTGLYNLANASTACGSGAGYGGLAASEYTSVINGRVAAVMGFNSATTTVAHQSATSGETLRQNAEPSVEQWWQHNVGSIENRKWKFGFDTSAAFSTRCTTGFSTITTDQAFFQFDGTVSTDISACTSDGSTQQCTSTGLQAAINTGEWTHFRVKYNMSTDGTALQSVTFYVNGDLVATHTTSIPNDGPSALTYWGFCLDNVSDTGTERARVGELVYSIN